jgi:hypothetical protein
MDEMGTRVPVTGGASGELLNSLDVDRTRESLPRRRADERGCQGSSGVLEFG